MGPLIAPLIAAGAGLAQGGLDALTARGNVNRTIQANREMADYAYSKDVDMLTRQQQYAREMWDFNNQYNAPGMQMQRLKEAGLNPNLVYGNGATATSGGQVQMSSSPKYNAPTAHYEYKNPFNLTGMIASYQDLAMRQAQVDNVKAQTDAVRTQTINERIRSGILELQGKQGSLDYSKSLETFGFDIGAAEQKSRQSIIDVQKSLQELSNLGHDEQLKILQQSYLKNQMSMQDIESEQRKADLLFKQYQNEWMKMGVTGSDNVMLRLAVRLLGQLGIDPGNLFK